MYNKIPIISNIYRYLCLYMHIKFGKMHSALSLWTHGMLLPRYLSTWLSQFFTKFSVIFSLNLVSPALLKIANCETP